MTTNQGGGWVNAGLGVARNIPYVGTAMRVIGGAQDLYLSEREKNRFYQGMEGGSNVAGFGERFREEAYRWTMPGMSEEMARQSFKGVTALGYSGRTQAGPDRQEALDFVYHNYNARGMDVEESLGVLQTASKDATVNFTELSEALKDVSDTAGLAGVNARVMREQFRGLLSSAINTGAGPGAADLAGIFSTAQASYGRAFQGSDFSGQLDRSYQYMIGGQYGVSPGQLQGIMRNKPDEYARMVSGSQRQMIGNILTGQQISDIERLIQQYGTSQDAVALIEQEFLNGHPEIDLNVVADALSGPLTGVQLDNSNVMDWIIQQLGGNTAAAHAQDPQKNPMAPVKADDIGGAPVGEKGLAEDGRWGVVGWKERLDHINAGQWLGIGPPKTNKAGELYVNRSEESGMRDPALEALLQNLEDPNNTKVVVSTSQGDKVVSFEDAMKYFPNELAKGNVKIATGDQAGKTVSDITGGQVDSERDVKSELTQDLSGIKTEDPSKYPDAVSKNEAAPQRVTVDLSTEAKRLLQILPSTNNESQATGYPPYNPNGDSASRTGP